MNWKKTLLFGGLVLGGAYLWITQFTKGIQYSFRSLKWLGRDGAKLKFGIVYDLMNTNDVATTVTRFEGKLSYAGHNLSDILVGEDKAITVQPGGTETLEIRVAVNPGVLLGELLQIISEKSGIKPFHIKGWMSGKIGQVPFRTPFNEDLSII